MQKDAMSQIEEWKNMDRTTPEASKTAFAFYDERIFPLVKEIFINKPENRPQRKYDGLILPVGFSPEPLILSILAIKPKQISFLYTSETRAFLNRIQEETELSLDQIDMRQIDGSNIVEMYEAIMALYEDWRCPANIAVDITGGKKSMVSGAAMAGAVLGADIYYVDTNNFNRDLGKPEPGSEYLSLLDNPYTVFGDMEADKAKSFYNEYDYAGAQRVFDQLEGQVRDSNKARTYQAYGLLCAAYEAWDNLDIGEARDNLNQFLDILKQFSSLDGLKRLGEFRPRLEKQQAALEYLQNIVKDEKRALCIPNGFHFAFMLYHNALRRERQGKLDMACLILYRLLEWIEQHRLAQHGINTSKPDYSDFDECKIFTLYGKKRKDIYEHMDRSALPNPIALVDGFLVLHALDDPVVKGLNWRAFRGQVEMRNLSVYAHGMNKINKKSFRAFKSTVEERFCKAQEIADIDIDTFSEQHEFIVS